MFGVGFFELVVIAVVALIFVGPRRLPEVMRQAGRIFVQVRRTANEVRSTFDSVVQDAEEELRREELSSMKKLMSPPSTPRSLPENPAVETLTDKKQTPTLPENQSPTGSLVYSNTHSAPLKTGNSTWDFPAEGSVALQEEKPEKKEP